MRKLLLLPLLLLLAACGATSSPTAPVAEREDDPVEAPADPAANDVAAVSTGTTPAEASVVRDQDWIKGAANAAVSIIEYGDFQ